MASIEIESLWQSAFGDKVRPELYGNEDFDEDGFQPLNDPQSFIVDPAGLTYQQLFAASANNQNALKLAQDEYIQLDLQIAQIKGKEAPKNPQSLQDDEVFEDRKESLLYGYKYEANKPALLHAGIPGIRSADDLSEKEKHDVRLFQEPFEQGGFIPTDRQYKGMLNKTKNPRNMDGWQPIKKNGKLLIPKQQVHHDEYSITYIRRTLDENGEIVQPESPQSEDSLTPGKVVNKRLTRTRFGGRKHPPTRDVSEAPSDMSTPSRKRQSTPLADEGSETPSAKKRRVNPTDRARPVGQVAAVKETVVKPAPIKTNVKPSNGSISWNALSPTSLRNRKWTDEELVEAVKQNHLWLHDDPAKAEEWKQKIINGTNPVRSFSMFKKWAYWKDENKDKRPRGKKDGTDKDAVAKANLNRAPVKRRVDINGKETGSNTPVSELASEETQLDLSTSRARAEPITRTPLRIQDLAPPNNEMDNNYYRSTTQPYLGYKTESSFHQNSSHDLYSIPMTSMQNTYHGPVHDYIGARPQHVGVYDMNGERNDRDTSAAYNSSPATQPQTPTGNTRSLRSSRRGSA